MSGTRPAVLEVRAHARLVRRLNGRLQVVRAAAIAVCAAIPAAEASSPSAAGLRVNGLVSPDDVTTPFFTWRMDDPRPDARQTAYRIAVRERGAGETPAWDSGWVEDA